jgi:hypothetical protein
MVVTNVGVAEHMRVRPGNTHAGSFREPPKAPGGSVAVHPRAAAIEQDRSTGAGADRPVDGPPDGWRQRDQDDLAAFAAHAQHSVAVLFAKVRDVGPVASKIRKPSSPSMATSAKSPGAWESRAAVSSASNCK